MKQAKRILSLLLTVVMTVSLFTVSAAAAGSTPDRVLKARVLSSMGLFKGYDDTGANFGLNDRATREQALIFLIRMLGKDEVALAWTGAQPYSDVPADSWARPYIGYAKENGLTVGVGNNKFGMGVYARMDEMTTFALRGLGYSDQKAPKDFTISNSLAFAKSLGILDSTTAPKVFTRGHAVDIIDGAVATKIKNQSYTLLEKLVSDGAVTAAQVEEAAAIAGGKPAAPAASAKPTAPVKNATVTGVKLDQTAASVAVGKTLQLTGTIAPENATNQKVTWSSSLNTIATVDANGLVTGVKAGDSTITVKTVDGSKTATCKVTVTVAPGTAPDTTVASLILNDRYSKAVTRFNSTESALKQAGLLVDSVKDEWSKFTKELNTNLNFIGEGTGVYTADQISMANAVLDTVDATLSEMDTIIAAAKAEISKPQTRTITVKFDNQTTADFTGFRASADGNNNQPITLKSGEAASVSFTVPSASTAYTVEFTEALSAQPYTLPFTFDATLKSGATITVTFRVENGNVVYEET